MVAISAVGGYIPRLRLDRQAVVAANGWFNPALRALGRSERAICNWDEDPITMAAAAINAEVPARIEAPISSVATFLRRKTSLMMPAFWRSSNGADVEAK